LEVSLLETNQYSVFFIDHFAYPIQTAFLISAIVFFLSFELRDRKAMFTIISLIISFTILFSIPVSYKLDRSKYVAYHQDLGIGAIYIYLDSVNNSYILDRVSPGAKKTIIGHYKNENKKLVFDKLFFSAFEMTNRLDQDALHRIEQSK